MFGCTSGGEICGDVSETHKETENPSLQLVAGASGHAESEIFGSIYYLLLIRDYCLFIFSQCYPSIATQGSTIKIPLSQYELFTISVLIYFFIFLVGQHVS